MIADQTGSLAGIKRRDYLPFGEEILAGVGHRQTANGYSAAQSQQPRQQFTGKERDSETGLDYFEARYYSSLQGRFTSPDEFTGGPDELYDFADIASDNPTFYANIYEPQSLNKYQYCYNNPLTYVDPDGHQGTQVAGALEWAAYEMTRPGNPPAIQKAGAAIKIVLVVGGAIVTAKKAAEIVGGGGNFTCAKVGIGCGEPQNPQAQLIFSKSRNQSSSNQGAPNQSGSNAQQGSGDEPPPFGHRGTQTSSTTVWQAKGSKERIDVENPNPGQRAGQIHYQDKNNKKYLYNPETKTFTGASKSLNKELLGRPEIRKAIQKSLKLLGEEAQ